MTEKNSREHASATGPRDSAGSAHRPTSVLVSLIPSLLAVAVALSANLLLSWSDWGVPSGEIQFGDLRTVTLAAECLVTQPGWDTTQELCATGTAPYNYPSWWAKSFALLGIDSADTQWVGWTIIGFYLTAVFALTLTINWQGLRVRNVFLMSFLAVSPPSLLAMQRGNIDMVIFVMLTIASMLAIRRSALPQYAAAVLLAGASTLKVYPAGAAIIFFSRRGPRLKALALFIIVAIAGLISIAPELRLITSRTPQIDGASFGSSLLPTLVIHRLTGEWNQVAALGIGTIIFLATWLIASRFSQVRESVEKIYMELTANPIGQTLFLAGSGTFLAAYLTGINFDYRLIMLFLAIAGLLNTKSRASWWLALFLALLTLFSYSTFIGSLEYLADIAWLFAAPFLFMVTLRLTRIRLYSNH